MKSYQFTLLITLFIVGVFSGYTNTTSFWATKLSDNDMHFQVYSGKLIFYIFRLLINRLVFP